MNSENMNSKNRPAWMADPLVKDIPEKKLDFLGQMFQESQGKNQRELMTSLLPMMARAKQENLTFTPQEMGAAIAAVRKYSNQDELKQIDSILERAKVFGK